MNAAERPTTAQRQGQREDAPRPTGDQAPGTGPYEVPEVEEYLDDALDLVEGAPGIPMSASVRVNREELLDLLTAAKEQLPHAIRSARWMLKEREEFNRKKHREADELIAEAKSRVAQMVQRTEVVKAAEARARQIIEEAESTSRRMRRETEDYCDQRLASFEIVLAKVQKSVANGRRRLGAPTIEEEELSQEPDTGSTAAVSDLEP